MLFFVGLGKMNKQSILPDGAVRVTYISLANGIQGQRSWVQEGHRAEVVGSRGHCFGGRGFKGEV